MIALWHEFKWVALFAAFLLAVFSTGGKEQAKKQRDIDRIYWSGYAAGTLHYHLGFDRAIERAKEFTNQWIWSDPGSNKTTFSASFTNTPAYHFKTSKDYGFYQINSNTVYVAWDGTNIATITNATLP